MNIVVVHASPYFSQTKRLWTEEKRRMQAKYCDVSWFIFDPLRIIQDVSKRKINTIVTTNFGFSFDTHTEHFSRYLYKVYNN